MIIDMRPYLSVVVPSYNEKKNLEKGSLDELFSYLNKQSYPWEVILTDDGSTDGTINDLDTYAKAHKHTQVLKNIHAGKAPTVKAGMLAAKGEWVLFTDFDQSTPISEVEKLLKYAQQGAAVVIGSREIKGAKRDKEPFYRHLMGKGFNFLVQILAVPGIYDTQCGFKLFSNEASEHLFKQLVVYGTQKKRLDAFTGAFDVEILFLARKNGYSIKEVPIRWKHNETNRVSPVKDSIRMLIDIVKIRLAYVAGKYKVRAR